MVEIIQHCLALPQSLTGWVPGFDVEPDFDGAEGEGRPLEDSRVGREAGAGVAEERDRVEQGPATFFLVLISGSGK